MPWDIDDKSAQIMLNDADAYAQFLYADQAIPYESALPCAAFMLLAKDLRFFVRPRIFSPKNASGDVSIVRVYFKAWSQNKFPAFTYLQGDNCWFCPENKNIFIKQFNGESMPMNEINIRTSFISGAKTRSHLAEALGMTEWLKDTLENQ